MWRRHHQEQGAVAIFLTLVTCFVMIPLAAFAVDIGQQRVARRDMQAVADTVALDMARKLGSGVTPTDADAKESADRNKGVTGETPTVHVYAGYIDPSATFISDQDLGCSGNHFNAYFAAIPSGKTANAVLVTSTGNVDFSLMSGSGAVCRSAIGNAYLQACMMMDSYAAQLSTGDSSVLGPLNQLLGTNVDTTVLGSSGILTTDLDVLTFLNVLKAQLGVGSVDQVLGSNVTAAQVLTAEVTALRPPYNTATAAAQVLQSQIAAHINSATQFNVGTLVGLTQGGSSALGATVNPLDLAAAAVQLANGTNAVSVSASSSNLTGLTATATIGSRPTRVCLGEGKKSMGQTSLAATADINAPGSLTSAIGNLVNGLNGLLSSVLNLLGGLLGSDTYDLPQVTLGKVSANVSLAQASGTLTALNCDGPTPKSMSVLEQSSLAPAAISIPLVVTETRHYGGVLGVGRKSETVTTTLTVTISTVSPADKSVTDTLKVPDDYDTGKPGPSGDLSLDNLQVSVTSGTDGQFSNGYALVGKLLNGIANVTTSIQNNLISSLESTVVTPLFTALTSALKSAVGLSIAGSTYTPLRTPSCNTPKLTG